MVLLCFFCVFGAGDKKNIGFTVFSELGTKKTLEIQCFRDFVVLGQKKRCFSVLLLVCSELGTKKQLALLCFLSSGQKKHWFYSFCFVLCVFGAGDKKKMVLLRLRSPGQKKHQKYSGFVILWF